MIPVLLSIYCIFAMKKLTPFLLFNFFFQLKTAREAAQFGLTGSIIGAVSTAGVAWKYSRSLHGSFALFLLIFF